MLKVIKTEDNNKNIVFDFYFPVPSGNNAVGISWYDALVISELYAIETIATIDYAKQRITLVFSSTTLSNAQRLIELTEEHTRLMSMAEPKLTNELKFTNYEVA